MLSNITEQEFDNISLTTIEPHAENAPWMSGNFSLCDSTTQYSIKSSRAITSYVAACIYWMIFIVGVTGNLLVIAVVIWKLVKSPEHQAMTIFVGSLAVSDLGLLLWVTWINALLSVNPEWMFGHLVCQMYVLWRSLTADCSIATLMFISVDRYVI